MNLRLKTNLDTEEKLNSLQNWLHLSSKAAVMRLGMSFFIKDSDGAIDVNEIMRAYENKEKNGADYLRLTIFGQDEQIYKLLIENQLKREITDEEFFPALTGYYIEKGVSALFAEYRYLNDKNKFLLRLIDL